MEGLEEINRNIEMKGALRPRLVSGDYGSLAESFLQKYIDDAVDRSFGILYENGHFMMGDKILKIYGDIMLDEEVYVGTAGLWRLITDKSPKTYTKEDYERYKELLHEKNVMYHDFDPDSSYPQANRSMKWYKVPRPIWEEFQQKEIDGDGLYLQKNECSFNVRRYWNVSQATSYVSWCVWKWSLHS